MSNIKVENLISVYERNGVECKPLESEQIKIISHWNFTDRVVISIEGQEYTVIARDLHKAITNAENH